MLALAAAVGLDAKSCRDTVFLNPLRVIAKGFSRSKTYVSTVFIPDTAELVMQAHKRKDEAHSQIERAKRIKSDKK